MGLRIEDYAVVGDCHTAALVGRDGSIDWWCVPRFDSGACFAALLGTPENGRWRIAPASGGMAARRRYRDGTLVLETEFEADGGAATVIDFMPPRDRHPNLVRTVVGRRGKVAMRMDLAIRFDYGSVVPWVQRGDGGLMAIGGPDMLRLRADAPTRPEGFTTVAEFEVAEGQRFEFDLAWYPSYEPAPPPIDRGRALEQTERSWRDWLSHLRYEGPYAEAVKTALIALRAMIYFPTGGIVAAPTTSLPEEVGGVRNWDYRYCWLRDATFTLLALRTAGFHKEAREWRAWLRRAVAGRPSKLQILYGLGGERRIPELTLPWLPGYEGSAPVRQGNAASQQFQLDVFGEVVDAMYEGRISGDDPPEAGWELERAILGYLESAWQEPDEGIWEVRGPRRHFTHSKVMAWVAFDRAVKSARKFGLEGPAGQWAEIRDRLHAEVCRRGFDEGLGSFVQSYGSERLDASLLMIPLVGFLPPDDPRVVGTVAAIERGLLEDGFVRRYQPDEAVDGLPHGEASFLPCSFWLADNYGLMGRHDDARRLFERLLALRNDVGLLAEEYDPGAGRLLGNFPQAFTLVGLVNSAFNLSQHHEAPSKARGRE